MHVSLYTSVDYLGCSENRGAIFVSIVYFYRNVIKNVYNVYIWCNICV